MSNEFKTDGGLHGDPPLPARIGSAVCVPRSIAICPECSCDLECQMTTPDIRDIAVDCVNENAAFFTPGSEGDHRYWQSEWEPVIEKVKAWLRQNDRTDAQPTP